MNSEEYEKWEKDTRERLSKMNKDDLIEEVIQAKQEAMHYNSLASDIARNSFSTEDMGNAYDEGCRDGR